MNDSSHESVGMKREVKQAYSSPLSLTEYVEQRSPLVSIGGERGMSFPSTSQLLILMYSPAASPDCRL